MIIDTTFFLDLLNDVPEAVEKAHELDQKNISLYTTAITVFEVWQGLLDINNEQKLTRIYSLLSRFGFLHLDIESAQIAGKIHISLYDQGCPIQTEDSMIAGICLLRNETLITKNVKHFSRVEGLVVETY